jgi:tRNA nucleotidyltransferase (CCA-adding enzyme)
MKIYEVGGAVRDELLGLPIQDRDWVVVGATPEDMIARGFRPVGRDFPVFLHPETQEEYALARTERKTAPGYRGFTIHSSPEVTLEDDLRRRDLTINAIAREPKGALVDPFGGVEDLRRRVLRHVSDAFAEDPVRILRVARFAARFKRSFDFSVAPETLSLMQSMVGQGEADALVPERVWQELARGLSESQPSEMFLTLERCQALPRILPELEPTWGERSTIALNAIDHAATLGHPLEVRYAALLVCLMHGDGQTGRDAIHRLSDRIRVPVEMRDLARITAEVFNGIGAAQDAPAEHLLTLIEKADGLRRPQRFEQILAVHACCTHAFNGKSSAPRESQAWGRLNRALQAALEVPAGDVARQTPTPAEIPARVRAARIKAIADSLRSGQA